jgi:SAM-dependent MidA family methyltransferase
VSTQRTGIPRSADLPTPSPGELARSRELAALIRREIETAGGAIDFGRFMELALYAPGLGYYSGGLPKFGAGGDFVTAPEMGEVFARLLARQCAEILASLGAADVLEAGAGSGALAAGVLAELEALGGLPREYLILELSAELRARQRETLAARVPHLAARVRWLDQLPARFRGVVIANELLDALPVERFRVAAHGVKHQRIGWREGEFVWRERAADLPVRARIEPLALGEDYHSEIGLQAEAWVRSIAERIAQGVLLLIDYGFPRAEFYHPQRHAGTLMCHYRQRAHGDPLTLIGLQDITAHIDFTAVATAGVEGGLDLLGYTSQAMFLIGCGLEDIVRSSDPANSAAHLRLTNEIQKLTSPAEMGELFKVMALGRGVRIPLRGFALQDRRARL